MIENRNTQYFTANHFYFLGFNPRSGRAGDTLIWDSKTDRLYTAGPQETFHVLCSTRRSDSKIHFATTIPFPVQQYYRFGQICIIWGMWDFTILQWIGILFEEVFLCSHYVLRVLKSSFWDSRCQTHIFKTGMT